MKTTRYVIQFRDVTRCTPWCDDPESRYGPTEDRATAERWLASLRRSVPSRAWRLIARTDEVIEPEPQPDPLTALEARIAALEARPSCNRTDLEISNSFAGVKYNIAAIESRALATDRAINALSARVSHLRPKKATRK